MNKTLSLCVALGVLTPAVVGCGGRSDGGDVTDSVSVDSAVVVAAVDTTTSPREALIASEPMPAAAEELFDDFIFNFAANRRLQMERIDFPVTVSEGGLTLSIAREEWSMERFFMREGCYTLILDSHAQLAMAKDTSVCRVVVEQFDLRSAAVKHYRFDRVAGRWRMTSMAHGPLSDNVNAPFITFYEQFATDSTVRVASIADPLRVTAPDVDDDFRYVTSELSAAEAVAMVPDDLPSGTLYNIVYGERQYKRADKKVLILRGVANGMEVELTFRRRGGVWQLTEVSL